MLSNVLDKIHNFLVLSSPSVASSCQSGICWVVLHNVGLNLHPIQVVLIFVRVQQLPLFLLILLCLFLHLFHGVTEGSCTRCFYKVFQDTPIWIQAVSLASLATWEFHNWKLDENRELVRHQCPWVTLGVVCQVDNCHAWTQVRPCHWRGTKSLNPWTCQMSAG